jgi:ribonuclease Z
MDECEQLMSKFKFSNVTAIVRHRMSRIRKVDTRAMPLGALRHVVTVTPGQKIAYVTDVADTAANRTAILELVQNADLLFIEAHFAQADAALADERAHLTTVAAGRIAREAGVRRVEPFHFSSRYAGEEERMLNEVKAAFGQETFEKETRATAIK